MRALLLAMALLSAGCATAPQLDPRDPARYEKPAPILPTPTP